MMKGPVYIIGYMGSGKSTTGKKLAKKLAYDFIDLDEYIEKKTGESIQSIFENKGENFFRQLESEALKEVSVRRNSVISLGGGTPCYNNNIDFIKTTGITVYLKMPATALAKRLSNSKKERPLIKGLSDKELLDFIIKQLKDREIYYNRADIIIDALNTKVEKIHYVINSTIG